MISGEYGLTFDRYKITINEMQDVPFDEVVPTMMSVLHHIIDVVLANVGERDIVRLRIDTESLDIPI
ncbi:hypothetical protein RvY_12338 [Ramazzottius varieornatus]|uniref:Uncharacterized protein n=1 Tax=Ramazzottius varieornatus TaxID=947166 RepID=A0A1D1VJ83_RAMVA|nr:hypothetical protein RvY_12338 [Ramazzottius varieornatus]